MHISQRSSGNAVLCSMMVGAMLIAASGTRAAHGQLFKRSAPEFKKGTLVVNLQTQVGTPNSKKGDVFTALVLQPSEFAGSVVEGSVVKVMPAAAVGGEQSHLVLQFSTITLPDNTTYRIRATFKDVVNAKGMARLDDEGQAVGTGNGKKAGSTPASGLAFSEIGPTFTGLTAGSEAISQDVAAPGPNMTFAPGTRFILDAENVGQDKTVNAYRVRQEAATEAAKSSLQLVPESSSAPAAHTPATAQAADGSDAHGRPEAGSPLY